MLKRTRSETINTREAKRLKHSEEHSSTTNKPTKPVEDKLLEIKETIVQQEAKKITTTVVEFEDLVDYEDGDLEVAPQPASTLSQPNDEVKPLANSPKAEDDVAQEDKAQPTTDLEPNLDTPETRLQQAKFAMTYYMQTILTNTPDMPTALQLTAINDTVTINVSANGTTYEVTWKITGTYDQAAATTTTTVPEAQPTTTATTATAVAAPTRCKFGRNCNKAQTCPFDHVSNQTAKPCQWVNTLQGCHQGDKCVYSHECAGVNYNSYAPVTMLI
ncbi:hypothetical protein GQ44DRAFT_764312 [Phaeosphaeriaceae sp. PMI808]|nr:hypothetical protein GQ44DRAFT_764312 [Phaeosphaeriaceae sp. PMI808]